jgi:hypothetical protein
MELKEPSSIEVWVVRVCYMQSILQKQKRLHEHITVFLALSGINASRVYVNDEDFAPSPLPFDVVGRILNSGFAEDCSVRGLCLLLILPAGAGGRQAHEDLKRVVYHPLQSCKGSNHLFPQKRAPS